MSDFTNKWEKRWHPLREEWVVYSAHRNTRPWQGAGLIKPAAVPEYDPTCYLCPGNKRVHGNTNPQYKEVFIFDNDHPVVGLNAPDVEPLNSLYKRSKATGIAKVICYDPQHNVTLSRMSLDKVVKVFEAFRDETRALHDKPGIVFALIFENKGEAVGVSNPHPHCQVYAADFVFKFVSQQIEVAQKFSKSQNQNIYESIIAQEKMDEIRVIAENKNAIAFIPFFARYAYEVMIFPKGHHQHLFTLDHKELADLSAVFHEVVRKLDMNYDMDFPYVMSVMQAPIDGNRYPDFRMHLWLQPPYRQPGLVKYLAGPEIGGGNFMADTMPEEKAAILRNIDVTRYNPAK